LQFRRSDFFSIREQKLQVLQCEALGEFGFPEDVFRQAVEFGCPLVETAAAADCRSR